MALWMLHLALKRATSVRSISNLASSLSEASMRMSTVPRTAADFFEPAGRAGGRVVAESRGGRIGIAPSALLATDQTSTLMLAPLVLDFLDPGCCAAGASWRELSESAPAGHLSENATSQSFQTETLRNDGQSLLRLWQLQHVPAMPNKSACRSNSTGVDNPPQQPAPLYADSVRRKRKHKMNKHKHRKRLKKMRHRTK